MRNVFDTLLVSMAAAVFSFAADEGTTTKPKVIVVIGAEGSPEFGEQFRAWSERWLSAAEKGSADFEIIGSETGDESDHDRLKAAIGKLAGESNSPAWIVLIGHGTFDGQAAKFNLRGPDVTANELADWLKPVQRPLAVINCASASAPFVNRLAGKNRVVIASTRSGNEQNFARFGKYMAEAVDDLSADLDKDAQVSLLEAYLTACRRLEEFYAQESRLATEHALLDDNGDGLGTPATWFRGLRATQRAKDGASLDGTRAHQFHLVASGRELQIPAAARERRDKLEMDIANLRSEKERLSEEEYFTRLEPFMLELSRIYSQMDAE